MSDMFRNAYYDSNAVEPDDPPEEYYACCICGYLIPDGDGHWMHEDDCPNYWKIYGVDDSWTPCQCDLRAHPECCPVCKKEDDDAQSRRLSR